MYIRLSVFLGVEATIVGSLLCCGVGIAQCLQSFVLGSFGDYTRPQHQYTTPFVSPFQMY